MTSTQALTPTLNTTTWTQAQIAQVFHQPLLELVVEAQQIHRRFHNPRQVQLCTLANIKSGHCPEDCAYCPQSARYNTGVETWGLPSVEEITQQAQAAKAGGSTRFCMGAAWRGPRNEEEFSHVCDLVRTVKALDLEVCVTLGLLNQDQAVRLKEAGVKAYNHNIDTAPEFYDQVISTRTFADRLETIAHVQNAGMEVCCGGILGMGETQDDRISFIHALTQIQPAPTSIPINALVPVAGTPLADQPPLDPLEMVRTIATTRVCVPTAMIRLSAGRMQMSPEAQALCFLAGANSIFTGETLLTTPNPAFDADQQLLSALGLEPIH